jgi:hypothetical protein
VAGGIVRIVRIVCRGLCVAVDDLGRQARLRDAHCRDGRGRVAKPVPAHKTTGACADNHFVVGFAEIGHDAVTQIAGVGGCVKVGVGGCV